MTAKLYKFLADMLTHLPYSRTVSLWVDRLINKTDKMTADNKRRINEFFERIGGKMP